MTHVEIRIHCQTRVLNDLSLCRQAHVHRKSQDGLGLTGLRGADLDIFANAAMMSKSANIDMDFSPEKARHPSL